MKVIIQKKKRKTIFTLRGNMFYFMCGFLLIVSIQTCWFAILSIVSIFKIIYVTKS